MQGRRRKKVAETPAVSASGDHPEAAESPPQDPYVQGIPNHTPEPQRPADTVPRHNVAWGNVVEDTLWIADPAGLARRLRGELSLGNDRTSYGQVLEALDRSARNLDDAGRLFRAAKLEEERYTATVAERLEVLRSHARSELMDEYREKKRPSPTQKDIEDRIVANWPDQHRTIATRIAELHHTVRSLETLQSAWSSRCADLRIMADKTRPTF